MKHFFDWSNKNNSEEHPNSNKDDRFVYHEIEDVETRRKLAFIDLEDLSKDGINHGARGYPDHTITEPHDTEKKMQARAQRFIKEGEKTIGQAIETSSVEITRFENERSEAENDTDYFESVQKAQKREMTEKERQAEAKSVFYSTRITKLKNDKAVTEAQISTFEKNHGRPSRKARQSRFSFILILIILGSCELIPNFNAGRAIGESSNLFAFLTASILSLVSISGGHFFAKGVVARMFKEVTIEQNLYMLVGAIGLTLSFSVTAYLRVEGGYDFFPSFINLACGMVAIVISYSHEKHQQYFQWQKELDGLLKELSECRKAIKDIEAALENELKNVEEEYARKKKQPVQAINEKIAQETRKVTRLKQYRDGLAEEIDREYRKYVHSYRDSNSEQRIASGQPAVAFWQDGYVLPLLEEDPPDSQSTDRTIANRPEERTILGRIGGFIGRSLNGLIPLIALVVFGGAVSGCDLVEDLSPPAKSTDIVVLIDLTDTVASSVSQIEEYIGAIADVPTDMVSTNAVTITISTIQETAIQKREIIYLPQAENALTRTDKKRKEEQIAFLTKLSESLQAVFEERQERSESQVMASLCQHLPSIRKSSADKRILVLLSDMLEHTPEYSFYQYSESAKAIRSDYEHIKNAFEATCTLPTLEDIEIQVVYLPNQENDDLFLESHQFWKTFLETKGATVSHIPNL